MKLYRYILLGAFALMMRPVIVVGAEEGTSSLNALLEQRSDLDRRLTTLEKRNTNQNFSQEDKDQQLAELREELTKVQKQISALVPPLQDPSVATPAPRPEGLFPMPKPSAPPMPKAQLVYAPLSDTQLDSLKDAGQIAARLAELDAAYADRGFNSPRADYEYAVLESRLQSLQTTKKLSVKDQQQLDALLKEKALEQIILAENQKNPDETARKKFVEKNENRIRFLDEQIQKLQDAPVDPNAEKLAGLQREFDTLGQEWDALVAKEKAGQIPNTALRSGRGAEISARLDALNDEIIGLSGQSTSSSFMEKVRSAVSSAASYVPKVVYGSGSMAQSAASKTAGAASSAASYVRGQATKGYQYLTGSKPESAAKPSSMPMMPSELGAQAQPVLFVEGQRVPTQATEEDVNETLRTIAQAQPVTAEAVQRSIKANLTPEEQYLFDRYARETKNAIKGTILDNNSLPRAANREQWVKAFVDTYAGPYVGIQLSPEDRKAYIALLTDFFANLDFENMPDAQQRIAALAKVNDLYNNLQSSNLQTALELRLAPILTKEIKENAQKTLALAAQSEKDFAKAEQLRAKAAKTQDSAKVKKLEAQATDLETAGLKKQQEATTSWSKATLGLGALALVSAALADQYFTGGQGRGYLVEVAKAGWNKLPEWETIRKNMTVQNARDAGSKMLGSAYALGKRVVGSGVSGTVTGLVAATPQIIGTWWFGGNVEDVIKRAAIQGAFQETQAAIANTVTQKITATLGNAINPEMSREIGRVAGQLAGSAASLAVQAYFTNAESIRDAIVMGAKQAVGKQIAESVARSVSNQISTDFIQNPLLKSMADGTKKGVVKGTQLFVTMLLSKYTGRTVEHQMADDLSKLTLFAANQATPYSAAVYAACIQKGLNPSQANKVTEDATQAYLGKLADAALQLEQEAGRSADYAAATMRAQELEVPFPLSAQEQLNLDIEEQRR